MTTWIFTSLSASPGTTTTALAVAASARPTALVVEADPFGGTLAPRFGLGPRPGIATLAAARRDHSPAAIRGHVQVLPGGLEVVVGLPSLAQSPALASAWDSISDGLRAMGGPVVIDAGRLLIGPGAPSALIRRADVLAVVARPELAEIARLRAARDLLIELNPRPALVLVGERPYGPAEVGAACDMEVLGVIAHDPGAAALVGGSAGSARALRRSALARSAAALAQTLLARSAAGSHEEAPGDEPSRVSQTAEVASPVAEEVSL